MRSTIGRGLAAKAKPKKPSVMLSLWHSQPILNGNGTARSDLRGFPLFSLDCEPFERVLCDRLGLLFRRNTVQKVAGTLRVPSAETQKALLFEGYGTWNVPTTWLHGTVLCLDAWASHRKPWMHIGNAAE